MGFDDTEDPVVLQLPGEPADLVVDGEDSGFFTLHDDVVYVVSVNPGGPQEGGGGPPRLRAVDVTDEPDAKGYAVPRYAVALDEESEITEWSGPVVADTGDRRVVVTSYSTLISGTGTEADKAPAYLAAFDAEDGEQVWIIELPEGFGGQAEAKIGSDGDTVVISDPSTPDHPTAAAFDLASGDELWTLPDAEHLAIDDGVAALDMATRIVGVDAKNGKEIWHLDVDDPSGFEDLAYVEEIEPGLLAVQRPVEESDGFGSDYELDIRTVTTNDTIATMKGIQQGCSLIFLTDNAVVCQERHEGNPEHRLVAFDRGSGQLLWDPPTEDRIAAEISASRGDVLYGTADNAALILDARTGKDLVTDLPITPDIVLPGFGIVHKSPGLLIYPATN